MPIVRRLKAYTSQSSLSFFRVVEEKKLRFETEETNVEARKLLVRDARLIMLDYQVHRGLILTLKNEVDLVSHILEALEVARELEEAYRAPLPAEAAQLRTDIEAYQKWIKGAEHFSTPVNALQNPGAFVRSWTVFINFPRLLAVRLRRTIITLEPLLDGVYAQMAKDFENASRGLASYQAWIFFMPRLLSNLIFFCKHVIEHPWMSQAEKDLGWEARFMTQLDRRWVDLLNDLTWFTSGLITCFVLSASWAYLAVYANALTQSMDIIYTIVRTSYDRHRYLEYLEKPYQSMLNSSLACEQGAIELHLTALTYRLDIEKQLLWLALANFTILFIASCMLCFTATPLVPFIGALLLVSMTLANFVTGSYLRSLIPGSNIGEFLSKNPSPKQDKDMKPFSLAVSRSDSYINDYKVAQETAQLILDGTIIAPVTSNVF